MLTSSHGRGWYVSANVHRRNFPTRWNPSARPQPRLRAWRHRRTSCTPKRHRPALDEAEELSIAPGARLFHLEPHQAVNSTAYRSRSTLRSLPASHEGVGPERRRSSNGVAVPRLLLDAGVELGRAAIRRSRRMPPMPDARDRQASGDRGRAMPILTVMQQTHRRYSAGGRCCPRPYAMQAIDIAFGPPSAASRPADRLREGKIETMAG